MTIPCPANGPVSARGYLGRKWLHQAVSSHASRSVGYFGSKGFIRYLSPNGGNPGTLFYGKRGEYCYCKYRVFLYPQNFLTLSCRVTRHTYSESVSRCPCMKSGKFLRGTMVEALRSALIVIKLYGLLYICRVWSIGQIHSQGPTRTPYSGGEAAPHFCIV